MIDTIFKPRHTITRKISADIETIERNQFLIENILLMPKHEAWLKREIAVERAAATTRIEGANLDEAAVRALVRSGKVNLNENERANINAVGAYAFVDYLSDLPEQPLDELVIRQLNREFLLGIGHEATPGEMPGMYRNGQNTVGNHYMPPNQGDVPGLMRAFAAWLQSDTSVHPVIKSGIAHLEFVAIHPFWDGNGRVSRALATLILQRGGHGFKKLLSFEKVLWQTRDAYFRALDRTLGGSYRRDYDATHWLEFWTQTLVAHTTALAAKLTDWRRMMDDLYRDFDRLGLKHREIDALMFAVKVGPMTRSDYVEIAKVSPLTASRDLARLVDQGWLIAEGRTRDRIYHFTSPESMKPAKADPRQAELFDPSGTIAQE